jgi:hypothetical protein
LRNKTEKKNGIPGFFSKKSNWDHYSIAFGNFTKNIKNKRRKLQKSPNKNLIFAKIAKKNI